MTRTLRAGAVLTMLACLMVITAVPSAAEDVVDLPSPTVTLPADASTVVQFPFTPVGAAPPGGYMVSVVRVLRDGRPVSASVSAAVRASVVPAVPAIALAVDVDTLDQVGTYAVTVAIAAAARRELVDLQLVRSGATVQVPAAVEVRRTVLLPGLVESCLGLCSDEMPELRLVGGADTRLTALAVYPQGGPAHPVSTGTFDGTTAVPLPVPLTDGGSLRLPYRLPAPEDSKLGTETTPLRITSPQLAAELPVDVRVTTVRSPALIVGIAGLGLLLGWLVRFGLVGIRRRAALRTGGAALADRIDDLLADVEDATFRKKATTLRDEVRSTSSWGDLQKGEEQLSAVATAVNTAHEDLRTRLAAADECRRPFASALRAPWAVDGRLAERITAAVALLDGVDGRLDAYDADGAQDSLDLLDRQVKTELAPVARRVVEHDAAAAQAVLELPGVDQRPALHPALPRLRAVSGLSAPADGAPLADVLGVAHQSAVEARACARDLDAGVVRVVEQAGDDYREGVEAAAAQVRDGLAGPDPLQSAADLLPALLDADQDQILSATTDDSIDTPGAPPPAERPAQRWFASRRVAVRVSTIAAATLGWMAECVRFLLMLAVLSVLAYGVFGPDWTGTTSQMLAVFSWAFVLDVGLQAIQSALPGGALPGAAPSPGVVGPTAATPPEGAAAPHVPTS